MEELDPNPDSSVSKACVLTLPHTKISSLSCLHFLSSPQMSCEHKCPFFAANCLFGSQSPKAAAAAGHFESCFLDILLIHLLICSFSQQTVSGSSPGQRLPVSGVWLSYCNITGGLERRKNKESQPGLEWWLSCFLLRESEWRSCQILNLLKPSHVQSGDLSLHASPRLHTAACGLMGKACICLISDTVMRRNRH